ncbi:hypothetical protein [Pseudoxanthomonas sp. PXM02]|uniref:hypothetical protein n=1 Tax=Pseudoxanthomonas sp. PXM02 TaxID=2769294 RepID=UPI00178399B4|nr:hypothetical protein [Pseudoxanthomonas sp. PXM02]
MNRSLVLCLALTVALAACQQQAPADQAVAPAPAPAAVEPAAPPIAPGKQLERPMPDGIALQVPYNAVYDKDLAAKDGGTRRRVILEFLDGNVESIGTQLEGQLKTAGYRKGKPRDEEGGVRTNYARTRDGSKVSILIRPKLDQRFRDDRALGTVSFSWTPPKTN